jgi:hypothetical protein
LKSKQLARATILARAKEKDQAYRDGFNAGLEAAARVAWLEAVNNSHVRKAILDLKIDPTPSPGDRTMRPTIVCLCGSTRFLQEFREANFRETMAGKIVLSIGCDTKSDGGLQLTAEDKDKLDVLHKQKIDLADEILVLNVGGYIGPSTRSEIGHAEKTGKSIRYLESVP